MRRLMWFSIGFGTGCGLCAYVLNQGWMLPLALAAFLPGLILLIAGRNSVALRRAGYALSGLALGLGWFAGYRAMYLRPAIAMDGETIYARIIASDYSYSTDYGAAVDGYIVLEGKSYRVRAYLKESRDIVPGEGISGTFRFRITTPDGEENGTYHPGKGIFLLAYQSGNVTVYRSNTGALRFYPAILAQKVKNILQQFFPEDTFAFAQALLLGDTGNLDYETLTAFKVSGIRHIVAVSGLHISIFYGLISALTFRRRYLTAIVGIPVLLLFAAMAGFTPSVTRACIMVWLMMLSTAFRREYDGGTALGFACLVMMLVNPYVITSAGFQLSVASVAGIFLFSAPIRQWLQSWMGEAKGKSAKALLSRWFCSSVSVSLSAISLTTPLCAWYFGTVSLVSALTNLLTLWAISGIFYGIIAVCVVSLLSVGAGSFLAGVVSWLIRYVLFVAKVLAGLPLSAVYTKSVYIIWWLVFVYLLLAVFLLWRKEHALQLICCSILGLCVALLCAWTEPWTDECRVTVLDVGQGQCVLLQGEGRTYLVDCGGDDPQDAADTAAETLLSMGISRLDGIILTHYDADHCGGIPCLLSRVDTDLLLLPDVAAENADELATLAEDGVIWILNDRKLCFGNAKMTVFGPFYSTATNENSLCVLFETENCAILITGDRSAFGERMLLRENMLPRVDLLIAGHHGSKSSTSAELLEAVQPRVAVISVGEDNGYGHPSEEVLNRLAEFGCTVYRTDENGTILYRR